jgi:REP element-mobilizing transposase RayT
LCRRFGHIENGEMILNQWGKIAHDEWEKTPQLRPNEQLGEFVIMPNHIHGINRPKPWGPLSVGLTRPLPTNITTLTWHV